MASRRLPPLPTIKDILRIYNIKAKKRLSQNFIMDPRLLDRVARAGGSVAGCHVVEVGPGPGGITRSILGQGATKCAVVEKDARFFPALHLLGEVSGDRLDIHMGDVLSFDMSKIFPDCIRCDWNSSDLPNIHVIGNLPFNVSTPLIIKWISDMARHTNIFSYGRVPLTLTFQLEIAQRMVAVPSCKTRSRLSVMCQNWAAVKHQFTIPGAAFVPKPDVDVGVVTLTPLQVPYIDLDFDLVNKVITTIFHGKQKNLSNTICNLFPKTMERHLTMRMMNDAHIRKTTRAIDLNMADLNLLCQSYHQICLENPSIRRYNSRNVKHRALGDAVYDDGQLYTEEEHLTLLS